jgi:hypothetical protein
MSKCIILDLEKIVTKNVSALLHRKTTIQVFSSKTIFCVLDFYFKFEFWIFEIESLFRPSGWR